MKVCLMLGALRLGGHHANGAVAGVEAVEQIVLK
jgi:hypothetical protein